MNKFTSELNGIFQIIDSELNIILLAIILAILILWVYDARKKKNMRYGGYTKGEYKRFSRMVTGEREKQAFKELSNTKGND